MLISKPYNSTVFVYNRPNRLRSRTGAAPLLHLVIVPVVASFLFWEGFADAEEVGPVRRTLYLQSPL